MSAALRDGLHRVWSNEPGLRGFFTAVNHGTIGLRYIATSLAFLLTGGMLAMFMRLQIAWPGLEVLDAELYNQFMTMHGTTMMFLFAVPLVEGIALYLVPKMIGARDIPFPRLTAFGYWCYLFGGLLLYSSFLFDAAPSGGWFMYVPLTGLEFTPDKGPDFWLLGVTLVEVAAVTASIELIVAVLKTRAPGMAIQRMPLFAWYVLVTAVMIVFAFPPLILASVLLEIERAFGFVFYDAAAGGDPLLWQHLFWLFGHPDVYIIFLPAAGIVSTLIPVFARRPLAAGLRVARLVRREIGIRQTVPSDRAYCEAVHNVGQAAVSSASRTPAAETTGILAPLVPCETSGINTRAAMDGDTVPIIDLPDPRSGPGKERLPAAGGAPLPNAASRCTRRTAWSRLLLCGWAGRSPLETRVTSPWRRWSSSTGRSASEVASQAQFASPRSARPVRVACRCALQLRALRRLCRAGVGGQGVRRFPRPPARR
jgi:hypothetical protein